MKKYLIISLLCLFLISCGFHLKGTLSTDKDLPKIVQLNLAKPDQELSSALKKIFQQQGITIAETAQYKIYLSDINRKKRSVTLAEQEISSIKEFILLDGFKAKIFRQDKLLGERIINSQMVIRYRSSAYLGSSLEEDNAHQRLALENAEKLTHFLQTVITR